MSKKIVLTEDLAHGWFANIYDDGSMTIRNPDLGIRTDLTRESVDALKALIGAGPAGATP